MAGRRIYHDIDTERNMHHGTCLAHIQIDRVVLHQTAADTHIRHRFLRIQRTLMVHADRLTGSNTWNDALSSAAVACHQMVHRTADADDLSADCQRIDRYTRSEGRRTDVYQIRRITVMVSHARYMVVDKLACKFSAVLRRILAVCSQCNHNRNLVISHAHLIVQIFYQKLADHVLTHPETRHITDHDRNRIGRCNQFL